MILNEKMIKFGKKSTNSGRRTCCLKTIPVHTTNQSQSNRFCFDRNSRHIWPKRFSCDAYNSNGQPDFIQPKPNHIEPKIMQQLSCDTLHDLFKVNLQWCHENTKWKWTNDYWRETFVSFLYFSICMRGKVKWKWKKRQCIWT